MRLRELWDQKLGLGIALLLAILAAARVLFGVGLVPPSLGSKQLGVASASTHAIVDTPRSSILDLRQDTYSLTGLTSRALLLGNVMASPPVRAYISQRAGVPAEAIEVAAPLTPEQPRPIAESAEQPKTSDILRSPDEYRLSVRANPTVPVLDIYSEAPDAETAAELANAAVAGLRDYLRALGANDGVPKAERVRLVQLGRASGAAINPGAGAQIAILAFLLVFTASCAAVLFVMRVRRGWAASAPAQGDLPATPS